MAELTINADEIAAALRTHVATFSPTLDSANVGQVLEVGDGIARVAGLPETSVNEVLEFEGGTLGLALNLDEASIGAVVLGEASHVEEGGSVKATGRILSVPVGDALIGRVVNGLGQAIDGKGPLNSAEERRLEVQAPGIVGRQPVHEPLQTGIKAIDAMTPIGRGQRELIIGDRKTGKTTVAVDTILAQKGQGVKSIYVAVGQKGSTVAQTVATLEEHGVMEYTVVVNAPAADEAVFKYLAPYAGCAIDVGISVSRVGGAAQIRAMRTVAGTLKVDLAQFRDLEAFATFASDLDAVSKAQLERGYRLVELLKQPLHSPMPVELQVVSVFAGTSGLLDDVPVEEVRRFEQDLHEWMQTRYSGLLAEIRDTGRIPEGDALAAALKEFHDSFVAGLTDASEATA